MRVAIDARRVFTFDPSIFMFQVVVEHDNRSWYETFGSEHELRIWINGLRAGYVMSTNGYLPELDMPINLDVHRHTTVLVSREPTP